MELKPPPDTQITWRIKTLQLGTGTSRNCVILTGTDYKVLRKTQFNERKGLRLVPCIKPFSVNSLA